MCVYKYVCVYFNFYIISCVYITHTFVHRLDLAPMPRTLCHPPYYPLPNVFMSLHTMPLVACVCGGMGCKDRWRAWVVSWRMDADREMQWGEWGGGERESEGEGMGPVTKSTRYWSNSTTYWSNSVTYWSSTEAWHCGTWHTRVYVARFCSCARLHCRLLLCIYKRSLSHRYRHGGRHPWDSRGRRRGMPQAEWRKSRHCRRVMVAVECNGTLGLMQALQMYRSFCSARLKTDWKYPSATLGEKVACERMICLKEGHMGENVIVYGTLERMSFCVFERMAYRREVLIGMTWLLVRDWQTRETWTGMHPREYH